MRKKVRVFLVAVLSIVGETGVVIVVNSTNKSPVGIYFVHPKVLQLQLKFFRSMLDDFKGYGFGRWRPLISALFRARHFVFQHEIKNDGFDGKAGAVAQYRFGNVLAVGVVKLEENLSFGVGLDSTLELKHFSFFESYFPGGQIEGCSICDDAQNSVRIFSESRNDSFGDGLDGPVLFESQIDFRG